MSVSQTEDGPRHGERGAVRRVASAVTRLFSAVRTRLGRSAGPDSVAPPPPETVSAALADYQGVLAGACGGCENHFIRLGRELEALHTDVNHLVAETLTTIRRTAGDDEGSVLMEIDGLVRRSLDDLNRRRRAVGDRLDGIDAVIERLKSLDHLCSAMARLAMNLRVVGFNIRVESARSTASQEMFDVVSEQINGLSASVVRNAERFQEDVQAAADRQRTAHDGVSRSLGRLDGLTSGAAEAVQGSAKDIETLMAGAFSAIQQAENHLRAISRQIGEVVAGIQIHDSMNQRITHINNALEDAAALCTPDTSDLIQYGDQADRRFTAAHSIVQLQIAQLGRIIADIEGCHGATQRAFDTIREEIEALAGCLMDLTVDPGADPGGPAEGADPFDALRKDLFGLHDLLREADELVTRIQETADAAVETTEQLEGHIAQVDGIGSEIRMIALNAIIKAAHLGETGSALEVVAQEVNILSNETSQFVGQVKSVLDRVVTQVRKLDRNGGEEKTEPGGADAALAAGIAEVTGAYERFRDASRHMVARAEELKNGISETLNSLGFLPDLCSDLRSHLERMEEIAALLRPRVREDLEASVDEVNRLTERYTMRLERGVHQQLLGEEKPSPAGPEAAPSKADELGDNVELF